MLSAGLVLNNDQGSLLLVVMFAVGASADIGADVGGLDAESDDGSNNCGLEHFKVSFCFI